MRKPKPVFRRLTQQLSAILRRDGDGEVSRWPALRTLRRHQLPKSKEVSARAYQFLQANHVGDEASVYAIVDFITINFENEIIELLGVEEVTVDQRVGRLFAEHTVPVSDPDYRMADLHAGVAFRDWPLWICCGKKRLYSELFCHDSTVLECYADAQVADVAKSWIGVGDLSDIISVRRAAQKVMRRSREEFVAHLKSLWISVPEIVAFARDGKGNVVGASTILPLNESAYKRVRAGELSDKDIDPCRDLEIPSRNLFFVGFARIEPTARPWWRNIRMGRRVPATHEHAAELINDGPPNRKDVRIIALAGLPQFADYLTQKGWDRLPVKMPGIDVPLFEIEVPSAEFTLCDFSTHKSAVASLIGFYWRMRNTD